MTTKELGRLFEEIYALVPGCALSFSGGEPFVRPDFLQLCERAKGIGLQVQVVTNGTLISGETAARLSALGVSIQLSLDGATAETNDRVRGEGSFSLALRGLRRLVDAGAAKKTMLSITPNAINLRELPGLLELALQFGVARIHISHLTRRGRAEENWDELELRSEERIETLRLVANLAKANEVKISGNYCEDMEKLATHVRRPPSVGCPVGSVLKVDVDGQVFPCLILSTPEFVLGNVRDRRFSEIVGGQGIDRASAISAQRLDEVQRCRDCAWRYICKGGCMGNALLDNGTVFSEDPDCSINRRLLKEFVVTSASDMGGSPE